MPAYSDLIERVLRAPGFLGKLTPSDPLDRDLWRLVRSADDATLAGGAVVKNATAFSLVRGGLLYALDDIHAAHSFFQDVHHDLGSYWHGMMHRREGDFDNARYWFRRAGEQPFFATLHSAAAAVSPDMARQTTWDPYLFTGRCEQVRHGDTDALGEMQALQRAEFEVAFDYTWRQAVG